LLPGPANYRPDGTVEQVVLAKIILRDGVVDVGRFPYPFVYPSKAQNPFVDEGAPDAPIPVQEPPPGADLSSAPEAVTLVLRYTDPKSGLTSLDECPSAPP
jgi:hypothetical protein